MSNLELFNINFPFRIRNIERKWCELLFFPIPYIPTLAGRFKVALYLLINRFFDERYQNIENKDKYVLRNVNGKYYYISHLL